MAYKLIYSIRDIAHSGSHIGRELEVDIKTSENISLNFRKRVLPDRTTKLDKALGSVVTEGEIFSLLLDVTLTEHDVLFNDVGTIKQEITFNSNQNIAQTDTITVPVTERRWFFWKKKAYFTLTVVTKSESIAERERVPTVDDPKWTGDFNDDTEQMILARVIFGEARSELSTDMLRYAVGWVVRNRVESDVTWWGTTYQDVITHESQFSAFNTNQENRSNRSFVENPLYTGSLADKRAWEKSYEIAGNILNGNVSDPTNGANHYYSNRIAKPSYYEGKTPIFEMRDTPDQHGKFYTTYFYKL